MKNDPAIKLTAASFGFSAGIFFAGYAIMQLPMVQVLQYVGARRVLGSLLVIWGLIASATGAISSVWALCVLRFLLGVAEAGYYPGSILYLSRWLPQEILGTGNAIFQLSAGSLGTVFGTLSAGVLLSTMDGILGLRSWRWLFVCQGLPAAFVGVLVLLFMSNTPHEARWLSNEERDHLLARLAADGATRKRSSSTDGDGIDGNNEVVVGSASVDTSVNQTTTPQPIAPSSSSSPATPPPLPLLSAASRSLRRGTTYIFTLNHFSACILAYNTVFFLPLMTSELLPSLDAAEIACVLAVPFALNLITGVIVGQWTDSSDSARGTRRRRVYAVVFACLSGPLLSLICGLVLLRAGTATSLSDKSRHVYSIFALLLLCLAGLTNTSAGGAFWALHHELQPLELRGASISLVNSLGNLGGFVGPYILGALKSTLGPPCPQSGDNNTTVVEGKEHDCVSSWAWGMIVVAALQMVIALGVAYGFCGKMQRRGANLTVVEVPTPTRGV